MRASYSLSNCLTPRTRSEALTAQFELKRFLIFPLDNVSLFHRASLVVTYHNKSLFHLASSSQPLPLSRCLIHFLLLIHFVACILRDATNTNKMSFDHFVLMLLPDFTYASFFICSSVFLPAFIFSYLITDDYVAKYQNSPVHSQHVVMLA